MIHKVVLGPSLCSQMTAAAADSSALSLSDRQQQKHGGDGDTGVRDGRLLQRS